jgi:hypothetical protein
VRLVDRWREIEAGLPEGWDEARLVLTVSDARNADRAAALLGPLGPGRGGMQIRFYTARQGPGKPPHVVERLLARLDREAIGGSLEVASTREREPGAVAPAPAARDGGRAPLAAQWEAAVAALPSDWSDLYAEVELRSSTELERAALLLAPVNPARDGVRPAFRFRGARRFGYGVSPQMAGRCLARLDEEDIRGAVRILRALSDSRPVATQGPVWYVGGKAI